MGNKLYPSPTLLRTEYTPHNSDDTHYIMLQYKTALYAQTIVLYFHVHVLSLPSLEPKSTQRKQPGDWNSL